MIKNIVIALIVAVVIIVVAIGYACCVVAGRADDATENLGGKHDDS